MKGRRFRLGDKLPPHQCDLTAVVVEWFAICCIRCARLACVVRKGSIFPRDSLFTPFTNSTCSFSTSAHFRCTAATFGNASEWNIASCRSHKSLAKVALGFSSFHYRRQPHP